MPATKTSTPKSTAQNLQGFFDDMLTDVVAHSPAVQNLHPLLKNLLMKKIMSGDSGARQRILKTLLKESHEYVELAAALKKKYGMKPEEYIQKMETFIRNNIVQPAAAAAQT